MPDPVTISAGLIGGKKLAMGFIGVGMVTERIKNDPSWRMWTTLSAVLVVALGYVSWSHNNMITQIGLRIQPVMVLVSENTEARKNTEAYTIAMAHEDKEENRIQHERILTKMDRMETRMNGQSRFYSEGIKMDARILRLEKKVYGQ